MLYTGKTVSHPKLSRENYFLLIKKLVKEYSIKLDYDVNILSTKSYKELKQMYRELEIQLGFGRPRDMKFGPQNYGNQIRSAGKRQ